MSTPELVVDLPTDPEFLAQLARAAMAHAHLDNALKMFVRSFRGSTVEATLEYLGYEGAKRLRERVTKSHESSLAGDELAQVLGFMNRCAEISERRNVLLHSPIARERYGKQAFRMRARRGNDWVELPKPAVLKALAEDTLALAAAMSHERLGGQVGLAIDQHNAGKA